MTAYESARSRLAEINRLIQELTEEKQFVLSRMIRYRTSSLSEAERLATASEPYQQTQLPESE